MARQTLQPDEWIVADGGETPVRCTLGQKLIWDPRPSGPLNLARNLVNALTVATGHFIIFMEDDDWYHQTHIEKMLDMVNRHPKAWAFGDSQQRYYNLPHVMYRTFNNLGASLCQTAIACEAIPMLLETILWCAEVRSYGIDTTFWQKLPPHQWAIERTQTVVGIKGLPGQPGLGIGHRPHGINWRSDPFHRQLQEWIGLDIAVYEAMEWRPAV